MQVCPTCNRLVIKLLTPKPPTLADIIKPIKKFKVTHAERPDIPQVFNIGDKVSFRGKMYFVKYVNPEDHMVQIELAKIRHGKVTGVVTGAIVNVKPDTILPWGVKPNATAIAVGGDEWNKNTAMRLEYDYAKVKPLLEKIAANAVGGRTEIKAAPKEWDELDDETQEKIESAWKQDHFQKELEYCQIDYFENQAIYDAKSEVADDFNDKGPGDMPMWYNDTLDEYISDRKEEELPELPYTKKQLFLAMQIGAGKYDEWSNEDAEVRFDEDKLDEPKGYSKDQLSFPGIEKKEPWEYLTAEMRIGLSKAILDAFETEAEGKQSDMEPPSYLEQQAQDSIDDSWGQMDDSEKYNYGKNNDLLPWTALAPIPDENLDQLPDKFDPLNETTGDDYRRTQTLARVMLVERASQLLVERGLMRDIDNARDHIKDMDGDLWRAWKDSSTTTNGMILQVAVAEELGGRLHEYDGLEKKEFIKSADYNYKLIGGFEGIKAYIRGKWETTQYLLDKANVQTLKLYRAIRWTPPFMGKKEQKIKGGYGKYSGPSTYTRYPHAHVARNGCASYTTSQSVANGWTDVGTILRAVIPRTAAISVPAYGINIHTEHECVIGGLAWQAWDAWKRNGSRAPGAPTFEEVPLDTNHMIERMRNPYYPKVDKREMSPELYNSPNIGSVAGYWSKYASQGQGKFKIGDKIQYGNVKDEYKVVSGPYQDGSYDVIHTPTGTLYNKQQVTTAILKGQANKVVTFTSTIGVGKDHGKSVEYKLGEIVKGHLSGNLYKIDKVDDDGVVHLIVQKTGPHGVAPPGDNNTSTIKSFATVYQKVDSPETKDKVFKTSEKYQKSLDKFKVGQTVYSKYQSGKGYVITGFMKNGDLDTKEINLKTGNPTDHYAQLVPDLIYTSKEDAKKSPESKWDKND